MPKGWSTRRRDLETVISFPPYETLSGTPKSWGKITASSGTQSWKGIQVTGSEGHRKSRDGHYHEGGPFSTYRTSMSVPTRSVHYQKNSNRYIGPCYTPLEGLVNGDYPGTLNRASDSTLDKLGATAISIVDPTNSNASTGQSIAEIFRDGLPIPGIQGWKRRGEVAKAAGSEFLNAQFGWLPLLSDISDTADSIKSRNGILKGYRDNAGGNGTHREFDFDDIESESSSTIVGRCALRFNGAPLIPSGPDQVATLTRTVHNRTSRRFSGRFTYASPDRDDQIGSMLGVDSEIDKLFGLSLTPDLLWELAPWSWAADWFTNAGDVIHNLTSFKLGGLVMRYGYIMETTVSTVTFSLSGSGYAGLPGSIPPSSFTKVTKTRRPANPFGFGLTWEGLSPTQLAITAALGITRLR